MADKSFGLKQINMIGVGTPTVESSTDLIVNTNGSERVRITSSGDVGIGTTNPTYSGAFGGSQKVLHISGTTAPSLRIQSSTSNQGDLSIQAGNSGADVQISNMATNGDIVFYTHPSGSINEAARFTDSGNLKFPSGQGIDFSATSDGSGTASSELLDDYEEGTWTPVYSFATSGDAQTNSVGSYVKVGSKVYLQCYIETNGTNSLNGAVLITGLPYPAANVTNRRAAFTIANAWNFPNSLANLRLLLEPNASAIKMMNNATNGTEYRLTHTDFTAAAGVNTLFFSGSYTV